MSRRIWVLFLVLAFFSLSFSGCYYFSAKKEMNAAEKSFSDLKAQGGEKLVPYEYCSAEKFLEQSKMEANESDWKQAGIFATQSRSASEAGLAQIQKKK
jgi:hypothetical protein